MTDGVVHCNAITSGFFDTLGVPMVAGRDFDARDDGGATSANRGQAGDGRLTFRAAIVNESLARRYFGNRNPDRRSVGPRQPARVRRPKSKSSASFGRSATAVSVRPTIRRSSRSSSFRSRGGTFWLRTRAASPSAFASIRTAVHTLDPGLSIVTMRTLDDQLDRSLFNERLLAMLASGFAGARRAAGSGRRLRRHVVRRLAPDARDRDSRRARGLSRICHVADPAGCDDDARHGVCCRAAGRCILGRLIESQLFGVQPRRLANHRRRRGARRDRHICRRARCRSSERPPIRPSETNTSRAARQHSPTPE